MSMWNETPENGYPDNHYVFYTQKELLLKLDRLKQRVQRLNHVINCSADLTKDIEEIENLVRGLR